MKLGFFIILESILGYPNPRMDDITKEMIIDGEMKRNFGYGEVFYEIELLGDVYWFHVSNKKEEDEFHTRTFELSKQEYQFLSFKMR